MTTQQTTTDVTLSLTWNEARDLLRVLDEVVTTETFLEHWQAAGFAETIGERLRARLAAKRASERTGGNG